MLDAVSTLESRYRCAQQHHEDMCLSGGYSSDEEGNAYSKTVWLLKDAYEASVTAFRHIHGTYRETWS